MKKYISIGTLEMYFKFKNSGQKICHISVVFHLHNEATAKSETGHLIEFSKGVILKDGSRLTLEELEEYAKK